MNLRPLLETPKYNLSVQASEFHYSTPRENHTELDSYSEVELALFDKQNNWVQPRNIKELQKFDKFDELIEYWEEGQTAVAAYVPMKLVNKFIKYINSLTEE